MTDQRELNSTVAAIARRLQISYDDAAALVRAVDLATQRLCPLWASWVLYHVVRRRFGDDAAVAAATAALIYAYGRADKDTLIDRATRSCGAYGYGVRVADASNVLYAAVDAAKILGLPDDDAWQLGGLLKYKFLQLFGAVSVDLRGSGVFAGELLAYAVQLHKRLAVA